MLLTPLYYLTPLLTLQITITTNIISCHIKFIYMSMHSFESHRNIYEKGYYRLMMAFFFALFDAKTFVLFLYSPLNA